MLFVYRNVVGPMAAAGHRVVRPDHLAFGRSDKPHDASLCTVSRHIERRRRAAVACPLRQAPECPGLTWRDWRWRLLSRPCC